MIHEQKYIPQNAFILAHVVTSSWPPINFLLSSPPHISLSFRFHACKLHFFLHSIGENKRQQQYRSWYWTLCYWLTGTNGVGMIQPYIDTWYANAVSKAATPCVNAMVYQAPILYQINMVCPITDSIVLYLKPCLLQSLARQKKINLQNYIGLFLRL